MNTIYRIVWNAATGKWMVASELAKGRKKKASAMTSVAAAVALGFSGQAAFAQGVDASLASCTMPDGTPGTFGVNGACFAKASDPVALDIGGIGILGLNDYGAGGGTASGQFGVAIGYDSATTGYSAVAIGSGARAPGASALAVGNGAIATGANSTYVGSTDAVNWTTTGIQAFAGGYDVKATGNYAVALGSITNATQTNSVALGYKASSTAADAVALGANSVANQQNTVSVGNTTTQRRIVNMAAGTQATDAVNLGQLTPVVNALGGGAKIDATTGAVTGPTYNLTNGGAQATVGDALSALDGALTSTNTQVTNLDGRVTINEGDIANLQQQIIEGGIGLVQQDATTRDISVAAGTDGGVVNFAGTDGARTLTGVAEGELSDTSADAVNGAQLYATNQQVAQNTTDISNLDGRVTINEGSITNLDNRVTTNEGDITNLQQQISEGGIGLVQQDAATGNITVGGNRGGSSVNMAGANGPRVVSGVANGTEDTDAVTIAQLKAVGLVDPIGNPLMALTYDDMSLASATLGGTHGTVINNLAPGLVAAGSMQAVNGGQLYDLQQSVQGKFDVINGQIGDLNDRVGTIEQGGGGGGGSDGVKPGTGENSLVVGDGNASGKDSLAVGDGSNASGDGSTSVGQDSSATGENSTAIGNNSNASSNNSVALGANSVADRDNSVSVGSAGNERQITHVAAGTARTDAANWGQVQDAVNGVQDWANRKFQQVDRRISGMGAMSAAYGQMAFSAQGINTPNKVGVGVGTMNGQSAIAVGYSRQIKPNLNISFGSSASANDVSMGAGLSFGWQ
jgi:trimeric autotransporter adhesin